MNKNSLKTSVKLGYGVGNFGIACVTNAAIVFLLYFYSDIIVLPPLLVGIALTLPRFWDAISDPLMGVISDRSRFSSGRRRPYILWGAPLLAISFILLWYPFTGGSTAAIFLYLLIANLLFTTSMTVVGVPYMSLGGELSSDYHERTTVFAYSQGLGMVGALLGMAMKLFADFIPVQNQQLCFLISAILLSIPACLFLWWTFFATRETTICQKEEKEKKKISLKKMIFTNFKNHSFRNLMLTMTVVNSGMMLSVQFLPFMLKYWVKLEHLIFPAFAAYTFSVFVAFPLWKKIGEKFDKKMVMTYAFIGAGISYSLSFFMFRPGGVVLMFLWAVLIGVFGAGGILYPFSMIADIADEDELKTGVRSEGIFYGTYSFILKLSVAGGSMIGAIALWLSGFNGGEAQSAKTLLMFRLVYVIPAISFFIAAVLIYKGYSLTEEKSKIIKEALNKLKN